MRRPLFVAFGSAQQLFRNNILESQWSGGGGRGVRARGDLGRAHDVHARGEVVGCARAGSAELRLTCSFLKDLTSKSKRAPVSFDSRLERVQTGHGAGAAG